MVFNTSSRLNEPRTSVSDSLINLQIRPHAPSRSRLVKAVPTGYNNPVKRLRIILGFLLPGLLTSAAKATTYAPSEEPPLYIAIVNSEFLVPALIIIVPIALYHHLKKRSRHKRGVCVKCAYDLRAVDHEACPECGEEIRKGNPA